MHNPLASKDIPHAQYETVEGRRLAKYTLHCGDDGCDHTQSWRPEDLVTPQQVLSHFRRKGWGIGRDRTRDLCPQCMMAGAVALRRAESQILRSLTAELPGLTAARAPELPKKRKSYTRTIHSYRPLYLPTSHLNEHGYGYNTRGFLNGPKGVEYGAKSYLRQLGITDPERDKDFVVYRLADGWAWDPIVSGLVTIVEPFEVLPFPDYSRGRNRTTYVGAPSRPAFQGSRFVYPPDNQKIRKRNDALATRGIANAYSARRLACVYLLHAGKMPWENVNFRRWQDPETGLWAWDLIGPARAAEPPPPIPAEEKPMSDPKPELHVVETPEAADSVPAQAPFQAKRVIRHYLDRSYDEENARWRGDLCDAKAAEELDVPPAWIAEIRTESYGPDVNEAGNQIGREIADLVARHEELSRDLTALIYRVAEAGIQLPAKGARLP